MSIQIVTPSSFTAQQTTYQANAEKAAKQARDARQRGDLPAARRHMLIYRLFNIWAKREAS